MDHFHFDQRGRCCFGLKQGKYLPVPTSAPTGADTDRCREFSSFETKNRHKGCSHRGQGLYTQRFLQRSSPTSWRNVRHVCWTWYCSDRFRMEIWSREYNTFETKQTNKQRKKKLQRSPLEKKREIEPGKFQYL